MASSNSDGPQLLAQSVTSVTEATANIAHTLDSNFTRVESMFERLKYDLNKSQEEAEQLMKNIITGLDILDDFIQGRFQDGVEDLERMEGLQEVEHVLLSESEILAACPFPEYSDHDTRLEDVIERENAQYLSTKDGGGLEDLQPTTNLLKNSCKNLSNVENSTSDRFSTAFQWFKTLERQTRDDTQKQQRMKDAIQRKLCQLQECLRARHNTTSANLGSQDWV